MGRRKPALLCFHGYFSFVKKDGQAMQTIPTLIPDTRLRSAERYLPRGCRIADVGTDHAYLPIYLAQKGIVSHALACDINQGPIESARENIRRWGLEDVISTLQTDGLHGVEDYAPDHVLIFGMGGELIVKILSEAPWLRKGNVTLILQPMTRASVLRKWLLENGFAIVGESLTFEDKYYQTVCARPSAETACDYTEEELLLGRLNIQEKAPLFRGFLAHEIKVLERIVRGKSMSAEADAQYEEVLLSRLQKRLQSIEKSSLV